MKSKIIITSLIFGGLAIAQEKPKIIVYTNCVYSGERSNFAGYLSLGVSFHCDQGDYELQGKWGEEIQKGYRYYTKFGMQDGRVDYIGDRPLKEQMPSFQKWCKSDFGYSLCGWNQAAIDDWLANQEKHEPAPPMLREEPKR